MVVTGGVALCEGRFPVHEAAKATSVLTLADDVKPLAFQHYQFATILLCHKGTPSYQIVISLYHIIYIESIRGEYILPKLKFCGIVNQEWIANITNS